SITDQFGYLSSHKDTDGAGTVFLENHTTYYGTGNTKTETRVLDASANAVSMMTYDNAGRLIRRSDLDAYGGSSNQLEKTFEYYQGGLLYRTVAPDGSASLAYFDPSRFRSWSLMIGLGNSSVLTQTDTPDPNNPVVDPGAPISVSISEMITDRAGREVQAIESVGDFAVDPFDLNPGAIAIQPLARLSDVRHVYDRQDRMIEIKSKTTLSGEDLVFDDDLVSRFTHDQLGQIISRDEQGSVPTRFAYDAQNNLTTREIITSAAVDPSHQAQIGGLFWEQFGGAGDVLRAAEIRVTPMLLQDGATTYRSDVIDTVMEYDQFGRLLVSEDPASVRGTSVAGRTRHDYRFSPQSGTHVAHELTTVVDNNNTPHRVYSDASQREILAVDASGTVTSSVYDTGGRLIESRVASDPIFDSTMNPIGQAFDRVKIYQYDTLDRLRETRFTIDGATGNEPVVRSTTDYEIGFATAQNLVTSKMYSSRVDGGPVLATTSERLTDAKGAILRETTYDSSRLISQVDYRYEFADGLSAAIFEVSIDEPPGSRITKSIANNAGGVLRAFDSDQNRIQTHSFFYDALPAGSGLADVIPARLHADVGMTVRNVDAEKNVTHSVSSANTGQTFWQHGSQGDSLRTAYDSSGNLVTMIDDGGNRTDWTYDALSRATTETVFLDRINAQGTRIGLVPHFRTAAYNGLTTYAIDRLGQVSVKEINPEGRATNTRIYASPFDLAANLPAYESVTVLNGDGSTAVTTDNVGSITFTYDELGRQIQSVQTVDTTDGITHRPIIINQTPNELDLRLSSSIQFDNGVGGQFTVLDHEYELDGAGRHVASTQFGSGLTSKHGRFQYGLDGQMTGIQRDVGFGAVLTDPLIDPSIDTKIERYHDGTLRSLDHELTVHRHGPGSNAIKETILSYGFTYDALDRMTSETIRRAWYESDGQHARTDSEAFQYDSRGQLTQRTLNGLPAQTYSYDTLGNRTNNGTLTGAHNRILIDENWRYAHDVEGNRTERVYIGPAEDAPQITRNRYEYDVLNRLVRVENYAGSVPVTAVEYTYDVADRRVARVVRDPAANVLEANGYVWDGDRQVIQTLPLISDINKLGRVGKVYFHGPMVDQLLAIEDVEGITGTWSADGGPNRTLWTLTDAIGTVEALVAAGGVVGAQDWHIEHAVMDNFGRPMELFGYTASGLYALTGPLFAGRDFDAQTGLYYNRARYFDPETGRFINEDPIGLLGGDGNLFRYAGNSTTNATDPSGNFALIGALLGASLTGLHTSYSFIDASGGIENTDLQQLAFVAASSAAQGAAIGAVAGAMIPIFASAFVTALGTYGVGIMVLGGIVGAADG
ncbi:MAG: RHS repeat-associated core domain-containing protein, partial [Planctomycetota bacterium]